MTEFNVRKLISYSVKKNGTVQRVTYEDNRLMISYDECLDQLKINIIGNKDLLVLDEATSFIRVSAAADSVLVYVNKESENRLFVLWLDDSNSTSHLAATLNSYIKNRHVQMMEIVPETPPSSRKLRIPKDNSGQTSQTMTGAYNSILTLSGAELKNKLIHVSKNEKFTDMVQVYGQMIDDLMKNQAFRRTEKKDG